MCGCFHHAAIPVHRPRRGFRHTRAYNHKSSCVQATRYVCWAELACSRTYFCSQNSMNEVCPMNKLRFLLLFVCLLFAVPLCNAQSTQLDLPLQSQHAVV